MNRFTATVTIAGVVMVAVGPLVGAQTARPAPPASPVGIRSAETPPRDGGWPRTYTTPSGARVVLYQPQIASWVDERDMTLSAAVSYLAAGGQTPALGTITIESHTKVALADRLVNFSEFTISDANFPTVQKDAVQDLAAEILATVPREERVIGLDRVLSSVETSQITPKNVIGVKADPPVIFFSQTPAVLLNLDGDPIWSPIPQTALRFAVNTNWDLFDHPPSNTMYLRIDKSWLMAQAVNGPWRRAGTLPAGFASLPADGNWSDVEAAVPGTEFPVGHMPVVFVSRRPAELILIDGAPVYVPVTGTTLFWLRNTDSDVFRLGKDGPIYFLVAGRWFSAPDFTGPWTFATPTLPADFARIPLEHPRSRVLASVPGTRQALEAVLVSQIPQTAIVKRREITPPEVSYQGPPQFEPIAQTTVSRAVNTDKDILQVGNRYYLCFQGVWFVGPAPAGPWEVADSLPSAISEIPISSPAHNVTYVTVERSNADSVEFVAGAAYSGLMVAWGCAVWGTGSYYPPYIGWVGGYAAYFPFYPTFGYGAHYNAWTGTYSRGGAIYGPYGGAGYAARYNPATGTYSRGAVAYGPNGTRGAAPAYNPRTGTSAGTIRGSNVYGSWGSTAVQRGDQWAHASRVTRNATDTTSRVTQVSDGGGAVTRGGPQGTAMAGRSGLGDVYAGRDGNIYRNQGGTWQKYGNGGWNSVERPTGTRGQFGSRAEEAGGANAATMSQLNRDRVARADGARRTRDLGRSGGGSFGSYRPSGGMGGGAMMGGGGRRR